MTSDVKSIAIEYTIRYRATYHEIFEVKTLQNKLTVQERHRLGRESEAMAADWFLTSKKAKLLARNYRAKCGELDLIFEELLPSGLFELVFIEVRAKSNRNWTDGPQSIDPWKQEKLKKTASHYLSRYRGRAQSLRLDLLAWDGVSWTYLPNLWI